MLCRQLRREPITVQNLAIECTAKYDMMLDGHSGAALPKTMPASMAERIARDTARAVAETTDLELSVDDQLQDVYAQIEEMLALEAEVAEIMAETGHDI
jgi:hypothetical protein